MTNMSGNRERLVVRSSVMPSAKYCWSGSLLRLAKGSTTIDRRGAINGCEIAAAGAVGIGVAGTVAWSAGFPAWEKMVDAVPDHHAMPMIISTPVAATPTMIRL